MTTDYNAIAQPMKLDDEDYVPEELPVYDDADDGIVITEPQTWSFDTTLARVLDMGLTHIHNHEFTYDLDGMMRARDIFRRYATKDDEDRFDDEDWKHYHDTNSAAYKDLMWALEWVKDNFTALWT